MLVKGALDDQRINQIHNVYPIQDNSDIVHCNGPEIILSFDNETYLYGLFFGDIRLLPTLIGPR